MAMAGDTFAKIVGPTKCPEGHPSDHEPATVEEERGPLLDPALDVTVNSLPVPRADERAHRDPGLGAVADPDLLGRPPRATHRGARTPGRPLRPRSSRGTSAPRSRRRCRATLAIDLSQAQSSITTVKFFAPPSAWTRLPVAPHRS